jgi:hypothetical protein
LFLVEINNRLGWVDKFSITAKECMTAINVHSYNTYKKNFDLLVSEGFILIIKQSTNQYQCNVVAISNFDKPNNKATERPTANTTVSANKPVEIKEQKLSDNNTILNQCDREAIESLQCTVDNFLKKYILDY